MVVLSPLRVACRSRALVLRGAIRGRLVHSSASPPLTSLRAVGADASLPRPLGAALARRTAVSSRAPLPFATTTSVRSRSTLIPSAVADDAFRAYLRVDNALDLDYVDLGNVAQPGRWLRLGFAYQMK